MPEKKPKETDPKTQKPSAPDRSYVEPGSDADATPVAEPGQTPSDHNK